MDINKSVLIGIFLPNGSLILMKIIFVEDIVMHEMGLSLIYVNSLNDSCLIYIYNYVKIIHLVLKNIDGFPCQ